MPKMKTHKGAAGRFEVRKKGKLKRRSGWKSHLLEGKELNNANWRAELQERIARYENRLRRGRMNETWARSMRAEMRRLQFYLDHDIDPEQPDTDVSVDWRRLINAIARMEPSA